MVVLYFDISLTRVTSKSLTCVPVRGALSEPVQTPEVGLQGVKLAICCVSGDVCCLGKSSAVNAFCAVGPIEDLPDGLRVLG
jgi:hypothetical protein